MSIEKRFFGTSLGRVVSVYEICNSAGASAQVLTYGGTLHRLIVPDRDGLPRDVVLGFDSLAGYEADGSYQGRLVGRFCNRIAGGVFALDGKEFAVTRNENGETCLHGGGEFSRAVWDAEVIGENVIRLSYVSPDGAQGFPGEMRAEVVYTLTEDNELVVGYKAVCDKATPVSLTNHAYFNLDGAGGKNVLDHVLTIDADSYLPVDEKFIPTGKMHTVRNTAFDFTSPKPIRQNIHSTNAQLKLCGGYDHNFCLNGRGGAAATVYSPESGIAMDVSTDMPGVQLYTGNCLDGAAGKGGVKMGKRAGFCLETQFYPDTPNHPFFPQCTIQPGETFTSRTAFRFRVEA